MSASDRLSENSFIHAATMLAVGDIERSVEFYRDKIGFKVLEQQADYALLKLEYMLLYFVTESPPTPDKPSTTLAVTNTSERTSVNLVFRVADCHKMYAALSERGVRFLTTPHAPAWGGWRCFARDPDGYLIEIEQPD